MALRAKLLAPEAWLNIANACAPVTIPSIAFGLVAPPPGALLVILKSAPLLAWVPLSGSEPLMSPARAGGSLRISTIVAAPTDRRRIAMLLIMMVSLAFRL